MARLVIKSEGFRNQALELKLGINRFGRSSDNDFQIEHATISARHCEIVLGEGKVVVRDTGSTNGTFLDQHPIQEAVLQAGQTLCLGDVVFLVETTDITIAIPKFDVFHEAPPVVLSDGSMLCRRHPRARATHQCTHCLELLCDACVHRLRRRGGKALKLCPLCSHACTPLGGEKKKKKTLLDFLHNTIKLPLMRGAKREE
jgi:hypothetical protein